MYEKTYGPTVKHACGLHGDMQGYCIAVMASTGCLHVNNHVHTSDITHWHMNLLSASITSRGENLRVKLASSPGGITPCNGVMVNGISSPPSLTMLPVSLRCSSGEWGSGGRVALPGVVHR